MTAHLSSHRTGAPNRVDRMLVVVLGSALPSQFRPRQQAEWAADLVDLACVGRPAARWRYLLAAAWTLPTLRALARHAQVDGPRSVSPPALPTVRTLAWVVAISLCWTLLSWAVAIVGPYLAFDVAARQAAGVDSDPGMLWPIGDGSLPSPLRFALEVGGDAVTSMNLLLLAAAVLVTVGFLLRSPGQTWRDRLSTLARGAVIGVAALAVAAVDVFVALVTTLNGVASSVTAIAAAGLAMGGFGMSGRWRVVLGVLAVAGFAVVIIDNTFGSDMVAWYRD